MKIKDRFNLSHVVGFFVGIVVTVIFNWVVFKDPKRITAPGVAALVAMSTFTLALWSASQVREWLSNKINETGYKQCELIIEKLRRVIVNLYYIRHFFTRLRGANKNNGEFDRIAKELSPIFEEYIQNSSELITAMESLPSWKIKFILKPIVNEAYHLLNKNKVSTIIRSTLALLNSEAGTEKKIEYVNKNCKDVLLSIDTVTYRLLGIISANYYKKFKHLSHNS